MESSAQYLSRSAYLSPTSPSEVLIRKQQRISELREPDLAVLRDLSIQEPTWNEHAMMGTKETISPSLRSVPLLKNAVRKMGGALAGLAARTARTLASKPSQRGARISDRSTGWPDCGTAVVSPGSACRQVEARLPLPFSGYAR